MLKRSDIKRSSKRFFSGLLCFIMLFGNGNIRSVKADESGVPFAGFNHQNINTSAANWSTISASVTDGQILMSGNDSHASYYINLSSIAASVDCGSLNISFSVKAMIGAEGEGELDTARAVITYRASEAGESLSSVTLDRGFDTPGEAVTLSSGAAIPKNARFVFIDLEGIQAGAANTAIFTEPSLVIRDTANPSLTGSWNTAWTNQDVTVTLDAGDSESGIEGIYDMDVSEKLTGDKQYQYTATSNGARNFYAVDYSGLDSDALTVDVQNIDKNAPAQTPAIAVSTESWSKAPVSFTLSDVAPAVSESPEKRQYKLNGGEWNDYTGQVTVSGEGQTTVTARVADEAGNASAESSKTVSIDMTAPLIAGLAAQTHESGGATITFTASDALSGVAEKRWAAGNQDEAFFATGGTVLTGGSFEVGNGGTYTVYARDNAGNASVSSVGIDTYPSMDTIGDQSLQEDETKDILFSVSDQETSSGSLLVSAVSSDTSLLPNPICENNGGSAKLTLAPHNNKFGGPVTVTVSVQDGSGNITELTFKVTVAGVNDKPVANDDSATVNEDASVSIPVLSNDTDAEGNTLSIASLGSAAHGAVTAAADGKSVTYTPNANFNGEDSFTYTATDGTDVGNAATVTVHVAEVNDLPKANNDSYTLKEDDKPLLDVLANDEDDDVNTVAGEALTIQSVSVPSHGTAVAQDGKILYTANADWSGNDSFTYTIADHMGSTSTATVSLKVSSVNDAPSFSGLAESYEIPEDTAGYEIQFQISDVETNNASLMLQGASLDESILPQSGLSIAGLGDADPTVSVFLTPKANANGSVQVSLKLSDGFLVTEKIFTLNVTPVNDLPSAVPDSFSYTEDDDSLVIDMDSLVLNDTDIDGDTLSFVRLNDDLTYGELSVESSADHTYRYIPKPDDTSTATFSYVFTDGTVEAAGTVTLTCSSVNDPPVLVLDPSNVYVMDEDAEQPLQVLFTVSDLETGAAGLIITAGSSSPNVVPVEGIAAEKGTDGKCTLSITPDANANGVTEITVTVSDGLYYISESFDLTVLPVPDPPTVVNDEISTEEGGTVSLLPMANDFDVDNDPILLDSYSQPLNGTVTRSGDMLIYKAPAGFSGMTSFTYTVSDGEHETQGTVTVAVGPYAHPPELDGIVNQFINEDGETAALPFMAVDQDAGDMVTVTASTGNSALVPQDDSHLILSDLGGGNYTLKVIPIANASGIAVITVTAQDKAGNSIDRSFILTVYAQNDLPSAVNDTVTTNEDQSVTFNVLDNDSDLETAHGSLKIIGFTSPSHGFLTGSSGSYTYTPYGNYNGSDSFTYTMTDGQASATAAVSLTVNSVNDAPYAYSIWQELPNETGSESAVISVLGSAYDVDGDTLYTHEIVTAPRYGSAVIKPDGTVVYTRSGVSPEGNGADSFEYRVRDRASAEGDVAYATATVYIGIDFVPSLWVEDVSVTNTEDASAFWISLPIGNPNGNSLQITAGTPSLGSVAQIDAENGRILYQPGLNENGWDSFAYTVTDSTLNQVRNATVYVYLYPVNDLPEFTQMPDDVTIAEDTSAGPLSVAFEDVETDGLIFTAYVQNTDGQHPVLLDDGIDIEAADGTAALSLTPVANAFGSVQVMLLVSDGLGSVTQSFTLNVTPVNDAPVAEDQAVTLREDTSADVTVIMPNSDVEGDALTVTVPNGSGPYHGTAEVQPDGRIIYTPDADYFGTDSFAFMLDDSHGGLDTGVISVTVTNVNDLPVLNGLLYSNETLEDTPAVLPFTVTDADNDNVLITLTSTNPTLFPDGSITVSGTGEDRTLTANPAENRFGTSTVTVNANDGTGDTVQTLVITVISVNDLPVAAADAYDISEDVPTELNVLQNDVDVEDAFLSIVAVGATLNGGKVINNSGTLTYVPAANYYGPDSFTYTVSDADDGRDTETVTINVLSVNDSPAAVSDSAVTQEDEPVVIPVLTNDSDVEGNELSVQSVSASALGAAIVINPDNTLTFTPATNTNGTDTFTYTVSDGQAENSTAVAQVTVRINAVNDAPVIENNALSPEPWEFNEDNTGIFVFNVSDVETDAKNLIVTMHSSVPALIQDTAITLTGTGIEKTISLVPMANAFGETDITVTVSDGVKAATRVFPVTVFSVNDRPAITAGDKTTPEDTSISGKAAGSDVEGAALTFSESVEPGDGPQHGGVTVQADGSYTYTPAENFNGADSFVILVDDGSGAANSQNEAVVHVTVTPVNDAPEARNDTDTTNEDTAIDVDVLANDTDIDTDSNLNAAPGAESISLAPGGISGVDHGTAAIVAGRIRFTPASNWNGTEVFTYTVRDVSGATDTANVTITVNPVDDAPVSGNDTIAVTEDTPKALLVLLNDDADIATNPGTEQLSVTGIVAPPQHGSAVISGDNQNILYTPNENYYGPDSLVYSMMDKNGSDHGHTAQFTVTLNVSSVNDLPVISSVPAQTLSEDTPSGTISFTVTDVEDEDGTLSVTYSSSDTTLFPDNDANISLSNTGGSGRTLVLTPAANRSGSADITLTVTDGDKANKSTVCTVTVNAVNDDPDAQDDTASTNENTPVIVDALYNDDVDFLLEGDTLDIGTVNDVDETHLGAFEVVEVDGREKISFTPDASWSSTVSKVETLEYTMTDAAARTVSTARVQITIDPVNDPPVISVIEDKNIDEDTAGGTGLIDFTVTDEEDDDDTLDVTAESSDQALFPNANLTIANPDGGTGAERTIQAVSPENQNGEAVITVTVTDSNGSSAQSEFTVTVNPMPDPPTGGDDTYTVTEDTPTLLNVLNNDDVDQDTNPSLEDLILAEIVTQPTHGTAEIIGQQLRYTPFQDSNADDSLRYRMVDKNNQTATFTVTIHITPVNDAPDIHCTIPEQTTDEGLAIAPVGFTVTDVDDAAGTLNVTATSSNQILVPNGNITIGNPGGSDRTVSIAPYGKWNGTTTITLTVKDDDNAFDAGSTATFKVVVRSVNEAPVAHDDLNYVINEDVTGTFSVLTNDTDGDLLTNSATETMTIVSVANVDNGTVSIVNGSTKLQYIPPVNWNGTEEFTYAIRDTAGATSTATVRVKVSGRNDAPVATADAAVTDEDNAVVIEALLNDSDVDTSTELNHDPAANPANETISIVSNGFSGLDGGTVEITGNTVMYTPTANWNGEDVFTYTIRDTAGATATAAVTVTVRPVNDAPVALDDARTMNEDGVLTIPVLENDSDADQSAILNHPVSDTWAVTLNSTPGHGTAVVNGNNTVTYTPASDWNGTDSFTYTVTDGSSASDTATVTVTVNQINDAPVALDDEKTTAEDTAISIDVLFNDSDIDTNASLNKTPGAENVTIVPAGFAGVDGGTVAIESGKLRYTPAADWNGEDVFTYTVRDVTGNTATANVTVTVTPVNDAPVALDDARTMNEDGVLIIPILENDSDIDQSALLNHPVADTWTAALDGTPDHGTAVLNEDNTVTYTPAANWNGTDTFTYTVSDGLGASDTATVTITVNQINDAPVALDDETTTAEDTAISIDVLFNDSDIDTNASLNKTPGAENVTIVPAGFAGVDGGTVAIESGKLKYTPAANWNGEDVFTYTVRDVTGVTATANVTVTVTPVNDAPVALDDARTMNEDGALTIPVLENDSDIDQSATLNHPVSDTWAVTIDSAPDHGLAVVNEDNTVTYTPAANWNGTDSFAYTVTDGLGAGDTAAVAVTVNQVNDAPVSLDDETTTAEDTAISIDVLANDSDFDTNASLNKTPGAENVTIVPLGFSGADGGTVAIESGRLKYTPAANWNGEDIFTYTVRDVTGVTATATVTVTVTPVNDAPVALDDARTMNEDGVLTIPILENDSDIDQSAILNHPVSDTWTAALDGTPDHGTAVLNEDNTVTYTPASDWNGTDTFTYTVTDGLGAGDTAAVAVTVNQVNDAPVALDDEKTTAEDTAISIDVLFNDSDIDTNASLNKTPGAENVTIVPLGFSGVDGGTVAIESGRLKYTPAADWNGEDVFTYTVRDVTGNTATANVTVTVTPVNDAPVALDDARTMNEDGVLTIPVLENDSDADQSAILNHPVSDTWAVTIYSAPDHGLAVVNEDNTITYTPAANWNGTDSFTYTVTDGLGAGDTAAVAVTVNQVNDAPVALDDAAAVDEDGSVTIDILHNDSDVDQSALLNQTVTDTFAPELTILPGHGTAVLNGDDTVTYTPDENWNGTDEFAYTIEDASGLRDTAAVTVTVTPVNDDPVAQDDAVSMNEDGTLTIAILDNDSDVDLTPSLNHPVSDTWTVTPGSLPFHGTVVLNADNTVTYTPDGDWNGTDSFAYAIEDSQGAKDTASVTVTILPLNDAPKAVNDVCETQEDTAVTIDVLFNDSDVDADLNLNKAPGADPLGEYIKIDPDGFASIDHGTVVITGTVIRYTPDADWNGLDSFTYTVRDKAGAASPATVDLTVRAVNDEPAAADDEAVTEEGTSVLIDVLENDTDIDTDADKNFDPAAEKLSIKAHGFTDVDHGTVEIEDGKVRFTPEDNWNGVELFTYTVKDRTGAEDTAAVRITVSSIDNAPMALNDEYVTKEDTAILMDVLANDTDQDLSREGDDLTIVSVDDVDHGKVTYSSDHKTLSFTPDEHWNGTEEFTYTVRDKGNKLSTAQVAVTVTPVNNDPLARDDAAETMEDEPVVIPVLQNDEDVDLSMEGDLLVIVSLTQPESGRIEVSGDKQTLTYIPNKDWNGKDTFAYTIKDSFGVQSSAKVKITVKPVNDVPAVPVLLTPAAGDKYKAAQTVRVTWQVSADAENDPVFYDLYFYDGSTWQRIAAKLKDTYFDHVLEDERFSKLSTPYACYRVEAADGSGTAYDLGDNFIIDSLAPQSVEALLKAGNSTIEDKTWVNRDVFFSLLGGKDLLPFTYEYRLKGSSAWIPLSEGEAAVFKDDGSYSVEYRAVDALENTFSGTAEIRIDKEVPAKPVVNMAPVVDTEKGVTIKLTIEQDPGTSGNSSVILPDGTRIKATDPIELPVEKNGVYTFLVEDQAGNQLEVPVSVGLPELADDDWLKPSDNTGKITFGRFMPAIGPQFPQGEALDNSAYSNWIKDTFNIDLDASWLVSKEELTQKIDECMEKGTLPDIFMVSDRVQLEKLIKSGMLANLTDAIFQDSSPLAFDIYQTYGGVDGFFSSNVRDEEGGIYAIPNSSQEDEFALTWIRKDWLDKLGMPVPATIEELEGAAKAFVDKGLGGGDTVGFKLDNTLEDSNTSIGTPGLWFHNYNAYPNNWFMDEATGKYVYGSVQSEVKTALSHLAQLYQQGLIDEEFETQTAEDQNQGGNSGILFGSWSSSASVMASVKANDAGAQWIPLWIKSDNGEFNTYKPDVETESVYWVMSANCERPDILVKMANLSADQQNLYGSGETETYQKHIPTDVDTHYLDMGYKFDWQAWPVSVKLRYNDQVTRLQSQWQNAVDQAKEGQKVSAFAAESLIGSKVAGYENGEDNSPTGLYGYAKTLSLDLIAQNKGSMVEKTIYVPKTTATMEAKWSNLKELERQTFLKIIKGELPIDAFDGFVKEWYEQGGREIMAEVNASAGK